MDKSEAEGLPGFVCGRWGETGCLASSVCTLYQLDASKTYTLDLSMLQFICIIKAHQIRRWMVFTGWRRCALCGCWSRTDGEPLFESQSVHQSNPVLSCCSTVCYLNNRDGRRCPPRDVSLNVILMLIQAVFCLCCIFNKQAHLTNSHERRYTSF